MPDRQLYLAKSRGFCAGVRRALAIVENVLSEFGPPVHILHEIVHNDHVVAQFRERGAVFVDSVSGLDAKRPLVFSAHGVPECIEKESVSCGIRVFDATCPLVKRIQIEAVSRVREGFFLVLIGHRDHPEIEGVVGRLPSGTFAVVERSEDVDDLDVPLGVRIAYVTQTTLSEEDVGGLVARIRARYPGLVGLGNVCYATRNRQRAVRALAARCDTVFVLGSEKSSNSKRLREVANRYGASSLLIRSAADLADGTLGSAMSIGITAAASAPEELVHELVEELMRRGWPEPIEIGDGENSDGLCCDYLNSWSWSAE